MFNYQIICLKVHYGGADLGITNIWYTPERHALVDFSPGVGEVGLKWVSKSPGRLSPATNIIRIFDFYSWAMIAASILLFTLACHLVCRVSQSYGVVSPYDATYFLIFPLAALAGAAVPRGFQRRNKKNKSVFSPGFAGNGLLLLWIVMGSFLNMAFLSNIRAILLIPTYDVPIETTEDIFKQDKIPIVSLGKGKK